MNRTPGCTRSWLWLALLAVLAEGTPAAAQEEERPVAPGERVRLWPVVDPADTAAPVPLVGHLLALGRDTIHIREGADVQAAVPRSAIARIERSIGHPHAGRNAGLAFLGTLAFGTVLATHTNCPASGDFGEGRGGYCAIGSEIVLVIPASGLAALLAGFGTPERFVPAVLPPR